MVLWIVLRMFEDRLGSRWTMQQRENVPAGGLLIETRLEEQKEGDVHESNGAMIRIQTKRAVTVEEARKR